MTNLINLLKHKHFLPSFERVGVNQFTIDKGTNLILTKFFLS
jgi:hypothetical protein